MKKEYRKPKLISAAEVDEIRKKIEQEKMIRRSLKRDGMTDEEIEVFFKMATEGNEIDWSNNRWRFRNNNRVCKLCGKPIYLSKDQETTRDQMHDICVYDDVIKTLLKGETLSSTQRSRLNHLGYTVTAFKKDYASEIKKG